MNYSGRIKQEIMDLVFWDQHHTSAGIFINCVGILGFNETCVRWYVLNTAAIGCKVGFNGRFVYLAAVCDILSLHGNS